MRSNAARGAVQEVRRSLGSGSADGQRLLVVNRTAGSLGVMSAAGSDPRRVSSPDFSEDPYSGISSQPSFSPDGEASGPLLACCCRHRTVDGLQRPSGRTASPRGNTPSTITSPTRNAGSRTEISPGARAHSTRPDHRAHSPPTPATTVLPRLTPRTGTYKQHSSHATRGVGPLALSQGFLKDQPAISAVTVNTARPRMWLAMLKPRNAGVASAGTPMLSVSRAWTTKK